eukprot:1369421-Pleurochrysis_carterae.AAC.2
MAPSLSALVACLGGMPWLDAFRRSSIACVACMPSRPVNLQQEAYRRSMRAGHCDQTYARARSTRMRARLAFVVFAQSQSRVRSAHAMFPCECMPVSPLLRFHSRSQSPCTFLSMPFSFLLFCPTVSR